MEILRLFILNEKTQQIWPSFCLEESIESPQSEPHKRESNATQPKNEKYPASSPDTADTKVAAVRDVIGIILQILSPGEN